MTIATPLQLRWERAQQIDLSAIEELGQGWYVVPSSRDPTGYAVQLVFDTVGKLAVASCTCPDFAAGTDAPTLHGLRVCKHVLAASLKARDIRPQPPRRPPAVSAPTGPATKPDSKPSSVSPNPLPVATEAAWDAESEEWVLTDSAGIHYCGAAPSDCVRQFAEATHYRVAHVHKNGDELAELVTQPADASEEEPVEATEEPPALTEEELRAVEAKRRQALARARGIANEARPALAPGYRLFGILQGDVLDWSDRGLFLAVESVTYSSLQAQGVQQGDPWGAVREIRMGAEVLHLRMESGWLSKVRKPCR